MATIPKAKNYILFTDTFAINDMDKEGKKFDRGMLCYQSLHGRKQVTLNYHTGSKMSQ